MQQHSKNYYNAGLCVLPAIKDEKRPAVKSWKKYQKRLPTKAKLATWFSKNPDALCIVTGAVSGNLEIMDFDHKAALFEPWAEFVEDNMPGLMDKLTIETTQRGGKHVIYRYGSIIPGNLKLARRMIDGKPETFIETRGEGGLFLCYPTPGYNLIQGDFENLPVLNEDEYIALHMAAKQLNEIDQQPEQYRPQVNSDQPYDGRPGDEYNQRGDVRELLQYYGWTYLGADSVNEKWRRPDKDKGGLSATLRIQDKYLYVFSSNAAPFESGKAYLPFSVLTLLAYQGDYERAARTLYRQGYGKPQPATKGPEPDVSGIVNQVQNLTTSVQTPEPPQIKDSSDPGLIPDEYFYEVPGFVRAYMEHCVETMPYKRPGMAFCGALSCLAWLTGRKVKSPAGIRPNIYILGIAGSGGGKDWARKINGDIFEHVGASDCLGKDFASGEGLEDRIAKSFCMLFQNDEIDTLLQCMKLNKEGRYERLMSSLLSLYTSSDSILPARAKAGADQGAVVKQPHLVLFGTATTENFYGAFSERMLTNGLFSRMMIIDMGNDRGLFHQPGERDNLPETIKEVAQFWHEKALSYKGNLSWENPKPVTVPYSGEAGGILLAFQREADGYYQEAKDAVTRVAWTRAGENARKLALLYACSEDHKNPQISETAALWAIKMICHQIKRQLYMVNVHYSEGPFHKLCQRTLDRLRKSDDGSMARGKLLKSLHIKARELDEIIDTLTEQGDIAIAESGISGTFKGIVYRYIGS